MHKSPFKLNFVAIVFVFGPMGDQHIFEVKPNTERRSKSLCGMTAQEIHKDKRGDADVTESKDRNPERPVCAKCGKKWRNHPRSPWKAWGSAQGVKVR